MKCKLCEAEFTEAKKFHFHVARKHKMKIEHYYRTYYPKVDLLTGEGILFKNYDFYFSSLFNTRENMLTYLQQETYPTREQNLLKVQQVALQILERRQKVKKLKYALSTVEARTSIVPSPAFFQHWGLDYNEFCKAVGMEPRFDYKAKLDFDTVDGLDVLVDTREQRPLDFDCPTYPCKLDFGDYTSRSHYRGLFIERKSLPDLCGTLSQGYERVQREFDRSVEMEASLVVCVEEPISAFMNLRKQKSTKHIKASSEFLAHRVREICQKYPNIQFLFLKDRKEMAPIIKKLFLLKNSAKTVDLQYCYDSKTLTA